MMHKKTIQATIALLLSGAAVVLAPAAAGAQEMGTATSDLKAASVRNGHAITHSGYTLMRIRTGAGGMTAEQRAEAVKERLVPILSLENLRPEDITVRQERPKQDAGLYVRDQLLITVDRDLARANGNGDPGDLARAWAERLKDILPNVSVKYNPLQL